MKCDRCDNEATVHEVTISKGKKLEKHLCESCALEDGIAVQGSSVPLGLLGSLAGASSSSETAASKATRCGQCGLTYAEFRQHGLLGCPDCYHAFEAQLVPLLERAQEGAAEHVGKTPKRSVGALRRQREITVLRKRLADALAAEQYEQAARLRDELHQAGVDIAGPRRAAVKPDTGGSMSA